ncbi:hypothetical protein PIB30_075742 [Stylosanthes scabra]|uniref:Uncharacterized protein n=1 Tax=Stylosanthes scabra TaxID=79078 RepID=A0ABU6UTR5_9FABA|nr:hypothetical protein [Stylosanthes scabra]
MLKVEISRDFEENDVQSFEVVYVVSDNLSKAGIHLQRNDAFTLILGTVTSIWKNQKWWFLTCLCGAPVKFSNCVSSCIMCQVESVDVVPRYLLKDIVSHTNGSSVLVLRDSIVMQLIKKKCSQLLAKNSEMIEDMYTKVVPVPICVALLQKKLLFMVDPKPVGYEMSKPVYIVGQVWEGVDVISVLQEAASIEQRQQTSNVVCAEIEVNQEEIWNCVSNVEDVGVINFQHEVSSSIDAL